MFGLPSNSTSECAAALSPCTACREVHRIVCFIADPLLNVPIHFYVVAATHRRCRVLAFVALDQGVLRHAGVSSDQTFPVRSRFCGRLPVVHSETGIWKQPSTGDEDLSRPSPASASNVLSTSRSRP